MSETAVTPAVVSGGIAYLIVLAWAMGNWSYDMWGALVTAPLLLAAGFPLVARAFRGDPQMIRLMSIGLVLKLAGAIARYWMAFDAYEGATDAARYHTAGAQIATRVWKGELTPFEALPYGTGTEFLERFTGFVYMLTGTSRVSGFLIFSWIAYWGVVLFLKAATLAIDGLAERRYAVLLILAPSVVFWPASIGKEAYMLATLGLGTYGLARGLARRGVVSAIVLAGAGLGAAAFVRPHIVALWIAGMVPALLVGLVRGRADRPGRSRAGDAVATVVFLAVAGGALWLIAKATLDYLHFGSDEVTSTSVSDILVETTRRTSETGSTFVPPRVDSPARWPYAAVRTLTRPLPIEAHGLGQLLAAAEITALLGLCLWYVRDALTFVRRIVNTPYVTFATTTLFLGGLAYSSFANLGVLTRQKSLVFPFMLLVPCLGVVRSRLPSDDVNRGAVAPLVQSG